MNNVMSAIAEALIATGIGILVALPAVVAFNVFQKKGSDIEENANALGNVVMASIMSEGSPPVPGEGEPDDGGRLRAPAEVGA
jgi:biopolymer transport protein ExbB/biopolymer transport protein TolQ